MIVSIDDYLLGDKDVYRLRNPRPGDLWEINSLLVLKVCKVYSEHLTYSTTKKDDGSLELYPEPDEQETIRRTQLIEVLRDIVEEHKPVHVVTAHRPILIFPDMKIKRRYTRKF